MRLTDVRITRRGEWARLSGMVHQPWASFDAQGEKISEPVEYYFEVPAEYESWLYESGDPFLAALIPPAMNRGCDLTIDAPVSPDMLEWAADLQGIFEDWYPREMKAVDVIAPQTGRMKSSPSENVAAFFSQGVDSFYILLKNMRGLPQRAMPITHLLYVEGLDTPLSEMENAEQTRATMQEVAKAAGKKLIVARTNIRDHCPINYGVYYSGPSLSAVGAALARGMHHAMVASAADYAYFGPSASHALVEGRVRIGSFYIKYDGLELNRLERIVQFVGREPLSLKYMRVCTQNKSGAFNCGKCPKCLRTIVTLHLMGTLEQAETFPHEFTPKMVRQLCVRGEWDILYLLEIQKYANETQPDSEVTAELRRLLKTYERWNGWQKRLAHTPLKGVVPAADKLWRAGRSWRDRLLGRNGAEQDVPQSKLPKSSSQAAPDLFVSSQR